MYSLYDFWIEPCDSGEDTLSESNHMAILPSDILFHLHLALAS
jgi:hypothetical protein